MLKRIHALRAEKDERPYHKAARKAQLALLAEMMLLDLPSLKDAQLDK